MGPLGEEIQAVQGEAHRLAGAIATGGFGEPNWIGVPGEELPHVTHLFKEGHEAFGQPVVVVGGGNSAVDAALDLYRAGAGVTIVQSRDGVGEVLAEHAGHVPVAARQTTSSGSQTSWWRYTTNSAMVTPPQRKVNDAYVRCTPPFACRV